MGNCEYYEDGDYIQCGTTRCEWTSEPVVYTKGSSKRANLDIRASGIYACDGAFEDCYIDADYVSPTADGLWFCVNDPDDDDEGGGGPGGSGGSGMGLYASKTTINEGESVTFTAQFAGSQEVTWTWKYDSETEWASANCPNGWNESTCTTPVSRSGTMAIEGASGRGQAHVTVVPICGGANDPLNALMENPNWDGSLDGVGDCFTPADQQPTGRIDLGRVGNWVRAKCATRNPNWDKNLCYEFFEKWWLGATDSTNTYRLTPARFDSLKTFIAAFVVAHPDKMGPARDTVVNGQPATVRYVQTNNTVWGGVLGNATFIWQGGQIVGCYDYYSFNVNSDRGLVDNAQQVGVNTAGAIIGTKKDYWIKCP